MTQAKNPSKFFKCSIKKIKSWQFHHNFKCLFIGNSQNWLRNVECKNWITSILCIVHIINVRSFFSWMKLLLSKRIEYHDIQDEITNTYDIFSENILVVIDSQKPSKPNWINVDNTESASWLQQWLQYSPKNTFFDIYGANCTTCNLNSNLFLSKNIHI